MLNPIDESSDTIRLAILPLPGDEFNIVTRNSALAWLRDDFGPFHDVAWAIGAEGPNQDIRGAASFLSIDLGRTHEACVQVIETGGVVGFERDDDPREWDDHTLRLARICGARYVMNHSTGPFMWAFDELARELARRLEGRCGCEDAAHA